MRKRMRGSVAFGMAMLVALSGASAPILAYAEEAANETVAQEVVAEELPAQPEAASPQEDAPQEQTTQPMEPQSEAAEPQPETDTSAGTNGAEESSDPAQTDDAVETNNAEEAVEELTVQSEAAPSQQLAAQRWANVYDEGRIEFNNGWSKYGAGAHANLGDVVLFSFSVGSDSRVTIDIQNTTKGRICWKLVDGTSNLNAAAEYWSGRIAANKSFKFDHFLKAGDYRLLLWGEDNTVATIFNILSATTSPLSYPVRGANSTSNPAGTLGMRSWGGGTFLTYNDNRRMDYWRIDVPRKTQSLNVTCECMDDNLRVVDGVYVMDAQGNKIDALDMEGVASNKLTLNSLNAGTYYLRVATVNSSTVSKEGSYRIRWDATFVETSVPSVQYHVHRQTYGNENSWSKRDGATSGTTGQRKRLEAIWIRLGSKPVSGGIQYRTHVQKIGWQGWRSNGAMSGTRGKSKRLEAIQIKLTGQMAQKYDVYYRVHAQKFGWMGWAKNGASAGTAGYSYRLEAIQIKLVPKGGAAPGSTKNAFRQTTKKKSAPKGINAIQGWWAQLGGRAASPSKQALYRGVLHVEGTTARFYSGYTYKNGAFYPTKKLNSTIKLQTSKVRRVSNLQGKRGWYFDQLHLFLPDSEKDTLWQVDSNGKNYSGTSSYGKLSGKPDYF